MSPKHENDHSMITDYFENNYRNLDLDDGMKVISLLAGKERIESLD